MSVQAGIWNFDGRPVDHKLLSDLRKSLKHEGPDGESYHADGSVTLLYQPFHTTAESRGERQPHISSAGVVITWDGRLDNRDEILRDFRNDLGDSPTDVAIVAAAFDRCGTGAFRRFRGDWAVVIWNPSAGELLLARDYIGIRHLYYYPTSTSVTWCSHLSPLALCGDRFTLSPEYVAGYLAFYPDAHLTPYREIHSVPPGSFTRIQDHKIADHEYWTFDWRIKTRYKTDADYEERYRYLLRQAVRRRLRSDSDILAELSGGFDSSAIVCMADDITAKERPELASIDTFSFYDSNEPEDNDFRYFTSVKGKRGGKGFHTDLQGSGASLHFEYPVFAARPGFGNRAEIGAVLTEVIRQGKYRVMLSGTGGDEMNAQALDPRVQMADLLVEGRLVEMAKQLTAWSLLIRKRPWIQLFLQTLLQVMPVSVRAPLTEQGKVDPWIIPQFAKKHRMSARQLEALDGLWLTRPSVRDAMQTVSTLSRMLNDTAPQSFEKRYPYLDQDLVEFLTTIPQDQLLRPGQRRFLMRRALADILPAEVLGRNTKSRLGGRCYSVALEKHWNRLERVFVSSLSSRIGYVNDGRLLEALVRMKNGQVPTHFLRLLKAISFEFWLRDTVSRNVVAIDPRLLSAAEQEPGGQYTSVGMATRYRC